MFTVDFGNPDKKLAFKPSDSLTVINNANTTYYIIYEAEASKGRQQNTFSIGASYHTLEKKSLFKGI